MSLELVFHQIPEKVFRKYQGELTKLPEDAESDAIEFGGDWFELHCVLRHLDHPLKIAIEGDCPIDGRVEGGLVAAKAGSKSPKGANETCAYFGYMSPNAVRKVGKALSTLTEEEFREAIKQDGMQLSSREKKNLWMSLRAMADFYRQTAELKSALSILIC